MCVVSVVNDYFRENVPAQSWDWEAFDAFQRSLLDLAKLDQRFNQPDCEDPAKLAWQAEIRARLDKLEFQQAEKPAQASGLRQAIERAINSHNAEKGSDTPDFVLSEFLIGSLAAFDQAMSRRNGWYGKVG